MDKNLTEILLESECTNLAEFVHYARVHSRTHSPNRRLWVGKTAKWFTLISAPAGWQPLPHIKSVYVSVEAFLEEA